jgi:D-alanyl-D-alanine dipeptidase
LQAVKKTGSDVRKKSNLIQEAHLPTVKKFLIGMPKNRFFFDKIEKIRGVYLLTLIVFSQHLWSQQLKVIQEVHAYRQTIRSDSLKKMVELQKLLPDVAYDLRYATPYNFTGKKLYKSGKYCFLRQQPARALVQVAAELEKNGLGLKIFDAYRPYRATVLMWELVHDERYVANPAKGSGHNRGLAIDLTLIDLETENELDMGTGFDNFTDSAHHDFQKLSKEILSNRELLKKTMEQAGFRSLDTEWWHYSWPNDRNYEVLDIDFKKLSH